MENLNLNTGFIIAGILAIIAELVLGVATGFDLLVLGVGFIVAGVVGSVFDSFAVSLTTLVFLSVTYIVFGRSFVKKALNIHTTKTSVDALIGKKGVVVKKITPQNAGQVKVEGEIWRAQADMSLDEGVSARVQSVSGVTVTVS